VSDFQEQVLSWMLCGILAWCAYIYFTAPIRREFYQHLKKALSDGVVTNDEQAQLLKDLLKALSLMSRTMAAFAVLILTLARGAIFIRLARSYGLDDFADWIDGFWPRFIFYVAMYLILLVASLDVKLTISRGKRNG
jgi:hypothetical protein